MNPQTIIDAIAKVLKLVPALVQAGKDEAPVALLIYNTFIANKDPSQADLDQFAADTDALAAELDAPLPDGP